MSTEQYDALAKAFYDETGFIAPGKNIPSAMGGYDEYIVRARLWDMWRKTTRLTAERDAMRGVVEAAKALEALVNHHGWSRGFGYDCTVTLSVRNGLHGSGAVTALLAAVRALPADDHAGEGEG